MNKMTANTSITGRSKLRIACALALVVFAGSSAHAATTLYEDSFNGSSTSDLAGTAVQVSPDGELWQSSESIFKANGAFASGSASVAYTSFTPQNGYTYSFTASVTINAAPEGVTDTHWAGIAFYTDPVSSAGVGTQGVNLVGVIRGDGSIMTSRTGGAYQNFDIGLWNNHKPMTANLELVLDTTEPNWRVDYIVNGSLLRSTVFTAGNPQIEHIGLASSTWASGSFSQMKLTANPIPEASTTILAALAVASLALMPALRRRTRR